MDYSARARPVAPCPYTRCFTSALADTRWMNRSHASSTDAATVLQRELSPPVGWCTAVEALYDAAPPRGIESGRCRYGRADKLAMSFGRACSLKNHGDNKPW